MNTQTFQAEVKYYINFKRCEHSVVDWLTIDGPKEYSWQCFYPEHNEILLMAPVGYKGYVDKKTFWEECFEDPLAYSSGQDSEFEKDVYTLPDNTKDGHDYTQGA